MTDDERITRNIFRDQEMREIYLSEPSKVLRDIVPSMTIAKALEILAENSMALATDQFGDVAKQIAAETREAAHVLSVALGLDRY